MKQMKFTIYAIAALLLMGCAQVEESAEPKGSGAQSADVVGFDVYTQRSTRSGTTGDVTTTALRTGTHKNDGFGVFAYHTGEGNYSLDFSPDFMYNQQVKYNSSVSKFTYEPVKYWPNEEEQHVSFFAYAPWVNVTASTGAAADQTSGITGMTKNTATGDPLIHYVATTDLSKGVDLCWNRQLDQTKSNSTVNFTLAHALSKLNVKVQTSVDVNANTKIYIRSITFSGFTMKGSLNLNSATAQWTAYEKGGPLNKDAVTFYDGRRDGREGYVADDSELPAGINPDFVQSTLWDDVSPSPGVTNSAKNLFFYSATATEPAYVIPTGDPVDITIEYDIETADPKLKGYFLSDGKTNGTSIANRITKANVLAPLDAGESYTINITLGLTDVTFEAAEVRIWRTNDLKGALWGIFSVSSTKKVYFSQGNLQYQASTSTWRFAPNQYDMIGSDNANISNSYTGWIDLLGWGTGNNPTNSSTNNGDYSTFTDWGVNAISNGSNTANMWCTLTKDEWVYLLEHHTKGWSTVNGVNGYVIRPDGVSTAVATSYTAADWAVEEDAGSVFLPAGGSRGGTTFNIGFGDYWSSTSTNSNDAYYLYFHAGGQNPAASAGRFGGRSVRLVYEVPYFLGAGTEADPYLISSETDWNYLATKVNSGTNYAGKFFRQTANINVTTMVGNSSASRPFSGTYDGYGKTLNLNLNTTESHTAPFRFIENATIKNVVTTGSVHSTSNHPSGLVGTTDGTCTIQNCRVGANVGGAQHSGGIVGHSMSANISIIGCVYSGTLSPASGQYTGGILGWGGDGGGHTMIISNCLFAGTLVGSTRFHPVGIVQNTNNTRTVSNTYYTVAHNLSDENTDGNSFVYGLSYKGKFARSITAGTDVTVARAGATTVYDVSGITSYGTGILYGGVLYAGNGEAVSLTLSHTDKSGFSFSQYTVTGGGSLNNPTSNSPTLTMTDANQTINALFAPQ